MESAHDDDLLTRKEAAAEIGCCLSTVKKLIRERRLREVKIGPKMSRIQRRALRELIAASEAA